MSYQLEAMKRAVETLEDVFGKGKVDVTAINMLREAISKSENQAYSLNTQDMKIIASDFMSHPLSRGISDCEKAGETLYDAATEIDLLRDLIEEQKGTITALNIALGGKDSTSTENLIDAHDLDRGDQGLISVIRKVELSVIDRCADVCNHLALTTSIDLIAAQGCAAAIRKLKIS